MNYKRLRAQRRKNFNLYCFRSDALLLLLLCDLSFEHNFKVGASQLFSFDAALLFKLDSVQQKPFEGHKIRFYRANTALYVHFKFQITFFAYLYKSINLCEVFYFIRCSVRSVWLWSKAFFRIGKTVHCLAVLQFKGEMIICVNAQHTSEPRPYHIP